MRYELDVVVVGAGLAGLSAARKLVAAGKTVRVLEARDRVGGRNFGGFLSNGVPVELGGQWVGPGQDVVLELIAELGLETFPTYDTGEAITFVDGAALRYSDASFGLPQENVAEIYRVWGELETLAASVPITSPWQAPEAADLDRQTFDGWLSANTTDSVALRFFRLIVPTLFCAETPELSLLHFLFYIRSGNGLASLLAVTGGAQELRVVGGTHRISERMAEELGDRVQLGAVVRTIAATGDGVTVSYEDAEASTSDTVTGRHVIVAIPPTLAGRIRYLPPLPAARDALTQQFPAGSVIKIHVGYPRPFWRDDGLSGLVTSLDDAFNLVMDNSPPDGSCGVLVGFIDGAHARAAAELPKEQRHKLVVDTLVKYFGPQAAEPFDIVEQDWNAEEFTRGCYGGRLAAGALTQFGKALAEPVGRIHWAGAETVQEWSGYMDGAIRSGRRAADEILAAG
ncbi:flavin monoamine oxidase family protein [Mycobacterium bourgelatii]|uniref:Monoamine oxidase n=1 Tax=Mycobacterium bourgelatii TaxID=1273442 RepID=A0A7I9YXH1_MYCBU|nr:flavin monoamine oxidase family protein [Mycobacterium bourgelatii]MCV6977453.1 flavin monoamine oxidase family protein [Mycobacterium bourgelatii]GFG93419.1 monoamine oxidase [Mycobacterium bourgelatii]